MSKVPTLRSMRPEPARDRGTGGYLLPHPATGQVQVWQRATELAGAHEDHDGISRWKLRKVLEGAAMQGDLLDHVLDLAKEVEQASDWRDAKDAKKSLDRLANRALDASGAFDGSNWGTLLHTITEWSDAGRLDEVLPEIESWGEVGESLLRDLEAYTTCMAANGLVCPPEYIERILVNLTCGSGGTTDRLVRLPDGRLIIGDLKTQKDMDFGCLKIAAQLAEYAFADGLLGTDGETIEPMPSALDPTHALIMHLPVGKATCTLIELTPEDMELGWSLAQHAAQTMWFRSIAKQVTGRPYDPARIAGADGVLSLIRGKTSPAALEALWRDLDPQGLWTAGHTKAAAARKAQLLADSGRGVNAMYAAARAEAAAKYPPHVIAEGGPDHYAATQAQRLHDAIHNADWGAVQHIADDPYTAGEDVDMARGALACAPPPYGPAIPVSAP